MIKTTLPDLRIMFMAAYDKTKAPHFDGVTVGDVGGQIGELFYPTMLPRDHRRMGGLIMTLILTLDERLQRWELFGGPAFDTETRRHMITDILASAHLYAKSIGDMYHVVLKWFPKDRFESEFEKSTLAAGKVPPTHGVFRDTDSLKTMAAGIATPTDRAYNDPKRAWVGSGDPGGLEDAVQGDRAVNPRLAEEFDKVIKDQSPPKFSIERAFGVPFGDKLRNTYATLYTVIHGTIWQLEADGEGTHPAGVNPLQNALYEFAKAIDPLFKGEMAMKGEG